VHSSANGLLSGPSNPDAKFTLIHTAATSDFTVTAGSSSSIDIAVVPPPNAFLAQTGVEIFRTVPTAKQITAFSQVYTASDTGLQPNTEYCYNIQFRNGDAIASGPGPSPLCATTPPQGEECTEQTSFKTSVTFGGSGKADIQRPAPDKNGDKNFIQYTWEASKKSNFTQSQDRKKCCKMTIIEGFTGPDAPTAVDFSVDEKGDLKGLGTGMDTGPIKNRFCVATAIVVSCCQRFSFTNVITNARFRIFRADGTSEKIKGRLVGGGDAACDTVFIWPRISILETKLLPGGAAPISGVFWDNPGFRDVEGGNQLIPGLVQAGRNTKYEKDSVLTDETDFLTALYCDEDNNKNTIPSRAGAETLCAVIKWGYKALVLVGDKPENNKGKVFAKPLKVICGPAAGEPPSDEFTAAKGLLDKAYNDQGAKQVINAHHSSWVFEP
jgi:hypothetical protein